MHVVFWITFRRVPLVTLLATGREPKQNVDWNKYAFEQMFFETKGPPLPRKRVTLATLPPPTSYLHSHNNVLNSCDCTSRYELSRGGGKKNVIINENAHVPKDNAEIY